ncbi:MAG: extracellular solute-binding protein [Anaerolineae bacterium]|nr:extracellular solute-binding protein [Anaerolineae bacterium]
MNRFKKYIYSGILGIILLGGCVLRVPTPIPSSLPTAIPEPTTVSTPTVTLTPVPGLITLVVWVPDFLDPYKETGSTPVLTPHLDAFVKMHRDVQIQIVVKKAQGTGGLYHLLSTAYNVAPAILPDLIVLNRTDLHAAIRSGLVQPLEASTSENTYFETDFYAFTDLEVPVDNESFLNDAQLGIPLLTRADQMIYRKNVSATPPLTWTDVITGRYSLLFPALPVDGLADDALLAAYLSTGGVVVDIDGNPVLDRASLEILYHFFADMIEAQLLNVERALELSDAQSCWALYQQGSGRLSPIPAGQYWRGPLPYDRPSWMPTPDGRPIAIAHTWYVVLVATDPVRQEPASQLAYWLTAPEQMAELTLGTDYLPTRSSALQLWSLLPEDVEFLEQFLRGAVSGLPGSVNEPVRRALQAGFSALLKGDVETPEDAATYALSQLP